MTSTRSAIHNTVPLTHRAVTADIRSKGDLAYEIGLTLKVLAVLGFLSGMFPLQHGDTNIAGRRASVPARCTWSLQ